mgnify:CR=1 FL=1
MLFTMDCILFFDTFNSSFRDFLPWDLMVFASFVYMYGDQLCRALVFNVIPNSALYRPIERHNSTFFAPDHKIQNTYWWYKDIFSRSLGYFVLSPILLWICIWYQECYINLVVNCYAHNAIWQCQFQFPYFLTAVI